MQYCSLQHRTLLLSPVRRLCRACHSTSGYAWQGATPRTRSGAEAGRIPFPNGSGQEELPHVRGQGQRPRVPDCDGTGMAKRSYPMSEVKGGGVAERRYPVSEVRGGNERSYPGSEVRGGSQEELPHTPKPEARGGSWEEQPLDRGQGRWPGGPIPCPRNPGCMGAGGPRGPIPH